jgi:hypothetical protein
MGPSMSTQIYLISNPTKPTHRRLSFKDDMTTFEKGLGWVSELVNGDGIVKQGILNDALDSLGFYKRRMEALQQWQNKMRDPERTIVCDIIANGHTLEPAGNRYTHSQPKQEKGEPVGYVQTVIEALYENSDPVSVDAAELLQRISIKQGQDENLAFKADYWKRMHDEVRAEWIKLQLK